MACTLKVGQKVVAVQNYNGAKQSQWYNTGDILTINRITPVCITFDEHPHVGFSPTTVQRNFEDANKKELFIRAGSYLTAIRTFSRSFIKGDRVQVIRVDNSTRMFQINKGPDDWWGIDVAHIWFSEGWYDGGTAGGDVCTCGAEKAGQPGHSEWCDINPQPVSWA